MVSARDRGKRAVEAMEVFGFEKKTILKAIKELLKSYSKEWDFIEADNYSLLVDAIVNSEADENEEAGGSQQNCNVEAGPSQEPNTPIIIAENRAHEDSTPIINHDISLITRAITLTPGASSSLMNISQEDEIENEDEDENENFLIQRKRTRRLLLCSNNNNINNTDNDNINNNNREIVLVPPQHANDNEIFLSEGSGSIDCQTGAIITYQRVSRRRLNRDIINNNNNNNDNDNDNLIIEPKLEPGLENESAPLQVILPIFEGSEGDQEGEAQETNPNSVINEGNQETTNPNPNPNSNGHLVHDDDVATVPINEESISTNPNPNSNGHLVHDDVASVPNQPYQTLHIIKESTSTNPNPNPKSVFESNGHANPKDADVAAPVPDQTGTELNLGSNGGINIILKLPTSSYDINENSINDFFKMVEENNIKSYKILNPNFSLPNLLNEICQSAAVHFGTNYQNTPENDTEMVIIQKHDINDICKGLERLMVPFINEYNTENTPPFFTYISQNIPYKNANILVSLSNIGDNDSCKGCFENCILAQKPCDCAILNDNIFKYTNEGVLKREFLDECINNNWDFKDLKNSKNRVFCEGNCPFEGDLVKCPGHFRKKFIKECWVKCACSYKCDNRVVQRGIMCRLQVFMTQDGRGWGIRTLDEIPKGTFVCEFVGEILTKSELNKRFEDNLEYGKNVNIVKLDAKCGGPQEDKAQKAQEGFYLDPTYYSNVARLINHRCFDANVIEIPVQIESPDQQYYHLGLFTTRKIEALEELTWDYGIDYTKSEGFKCKCGSKYCRSIQNSRKRRRKL